MPPGLLQDNAGPRPRAEVELTGVERACGVPLRAYRDSHVERQMGRLLRSSGAADVAELTAAIEASPELRRRARRLLAMPVTGRRRDPEQLELLESTLIPRVAAVRERLRVWSAGCADGSELVDVGEALARAGLLDRAQLLGSDLLEECVAEAREPEREVGLELRRRLRWERRDLVGDAAPPGRFALVLCRNVCIYLREDVRNALHRRLVESLAPGGILLLGRSERLAGAAVAETCAVAPHAYERPLR